MMKQVNEKMKEQAPEMQVSSFALLVVLQLLPQQRQRIV